MPKDLIKNIHKYEFREVAFKQLMQNRIHKVLIVCSNYDYYMLEEDGRIDERIFNEYTDLNLRYPPSLLQANSAKNAIKVLENEKIDLVITWLDISSSKSFETSNLIRKKFPEVPIAALSHFSSELRKNLDRVGTGTIDHVFHWNGNADIFLAIIKLFEDRMNAENDIGKIGVKAILLVEDSLQFYSLYLPMMYKIILKQTRSLMSEGLNEHRRMMLMRGRPKIILATNYEEGIGIFQKYRSNLLGVISDVTYKKAGVKDSQAGFDFLKFVRKEDRYFPFLIQSSEEKNKKKALELKGKFLYKYSKTLGVELKNYITKYFSFGDFEFWDPKQLKVLAKAKNLQEFQKALEFVSVDSIIYHSIRSEYSKWLRSRALFPLANLFSRVEYESFDNPEDVRDFLLKSIKAYRKYRSSGVISKFDRKTYDEYLGFARVGDGSIGGKGRGLAFIDSFIKSHRLSNKYDNVTISIPRTVVISTSIFDEFMEQNELLEFVVEDLDDAIILKKFISKPLPEKVLKDIKTFLSTTNRPIAVRSSSVLEDSHYHPFAGVFSTYMVPNTDKINALKNVSNAIKSVFASSFFKNSKAYNKATSHTIEEDKMAVILQELTGKTYDDVYYPTISGVARSINFYPIGNEKPNEGIVNIAIGLGEIIVGGGSSLRFSPYHPKNVLQLSSPETVKRETQKYFYALELNAGNFEISTSEAFNKRKISIRQAKNHGSLKYVASTYDLQNNVIRPGILYEGIRVITFDNILKYDTFPLAEILQELLRIGQREMRNPIEIEFAINLDVPKDKHRIFSVLQIRPIVESNEVSNKLPETIEKNDTIIYSESALGNGNYTDIKNLVYVKPETFNSSNTKEIALAVDKINKTFEESGEKYILIGPGRWGSRDPWLGIPVIWSQISSAKVIVESGLNDYRIDPSQGTHFFQNLTSFKVGYLTINPFIDDGYYDLDFLNNQKPVFEDNFLKLIKFNEPLSIVINGKKNRAAIFKPGYKMNQNSDPDIEELPPEGFM
jgi:hypothetical protein